LIHLKGTVGGIHKLENFLTTKSKRLEEGLQEMTAEFNFAKSFGIFSKVSFCIAAGGKYSSLVNHFCNWQKHSTQSSEKNSQ